MTGQEAFWAFLGASIIGVCIGVTIGRLLA
jgi:hypothetical protein